MGNKLNPLAPSQDLLRLCEEMNAHAKSLWKITVEDAFKEQDFSSRFIVWARRWKPLFDPSKMKYGERFQVVTAIRVDPDCYNECVDGDLPTYTLTTMTHEIHGVFGWAYLDIDPEIETIEEDEARDAV